MVVATSYLPEFHQGDGVDPILPKMYSIRVTNGTVQSEISFKLRFASFLAAYFVVYGQSVPFFRSFAKEVI
ncbi:hypothetical protein PTKIN_Ptkin01aG0325800 [Pterospermum kingtungense]